MSDLLFFFFLSGSKNLILLLVSSGDFNSSSVFECISCSNSLWMSKWYLHFALPSLSWDRTSHIEMTKRWIPQNIFFEQQDHAIVLNLLTHLDIESASIWHKNIYLASYTHLSFNLLAHLDTESVSIWYKNIYLASYTHSFFCFMFYINFNAFSCIVWSTFWER